MLLLPTPTTLFLYQESQDITIGLGLFDQACAQMVGTDPGAKVTNLFRMQGNGFAADLVETVLSQHHFGGVDGGRKDTKLGHAAHV